MADVIQKILVQRTTTSGGQFTDFVPTSEVTIDMQPIPAPAGFRWQSPPLNLARTTAGIVTDFNPLSLITTPVKIYYVNPLTGNDGNAGTTSGTALQKLGTALAKSDVDQIQIVGLTANYLALGTFGWNNVQPTRSVSVLNRTGFRFISTPTGTSSTPLTWTVNGTYPVVYQTTVSSANSASVVDMKTSSIPTYVNAAGVTVSLTAVPRRYQTLNKVASIAAVAATPGTWYNDGTVTYVQTFDSRNIIGDNTILTLNSSNNGRYPSVVGCTIYVEGIDFVGGSNGFFATIASLISGTSLYFNNCSFQGAGVNNALAVVGPLTVISVNCGAYDCALDGFNYHSAEADGTTAGTSPSFIEIGCCSVGCGLTGAVDASNNATTCHDYVTGIRVNGAYINSADRVMADVAFAMTWNLGCFVGPSAFGGVGGENISAQDSAQVWLDTCYASLGAFPRWASITSAALSYYNSGAVVNDNANTGAINPYYAGGAQSIGAAAAPVIRTVIAAGTAVILPTDNKVVINKTVGAATAVTLPSNPLNRNYTIKDGKGDAATNNITITNPAGNIDGSATFVISTNYGAWTGFPALPAWETESSR
jgi:hypothetical protein